MPSLLHTLAANTTKQFYKTLNKKGKEKGIKNVRESTYAVMHTQTHTFTTPHIYIHNTHNETQILT